MSTREQMVETAARAISANEGRMATVRDQHDARAVLDAVLPQVTTVAELEALLPGSVVVSHNGYPFERGHDNEMCVGGEYQGTVQQFGPWLPLTVVWTPGVQS